MSPGQLPRVVVVTRPTEYEQLLAEHGTRGQALFFLHTRGRDIAEPEERHHRLTRARDAVTAAIPRQWRRGSVTRADLDRFLFEPDDVIVVVGQDGLVANVAKYVTGQPVIGVNPDPASYEGVLVRCAPGQAADLIQVAAAGRAAVEERAMAEARLDDGATLLALNEIFVGHRSHQSARYRLIANGIQARLRALSEDQVERAKNVGIKDLSKIYKTEDLAPGEQILFSSTGVTDGELLKGVRFFGGGSRTSTLFMSLSRKLIRFVDTIHRDQVTTPVRFL